MTDSHDFLQILIVEGSVVEIVADGSDAPRAISVEVTIDGDRLRGWEEPGWREVGLGSASGLFYWWSARRLVVVDLAQRHVRFEAEVEDDILCAFFVAPTSWLVVTETTARLIHQNGDAISRVECDEVVERCRYDGSILHLVLSNERHVEIDVGHDELCLR